MMLNILFLFNAFMSMFCVFGPTTQYIIFEENRALFCLIFLGLDAIILFFITKN